MESTREKGTIQEKSTEVLKDRAEYRERTGEIGDTWYFNLGITSPEIVGFFTRNRGDLALRFATAFAMLTRLVSDPALMYEELYTLAARHLNYGTQEQNSPVLEQAVMVMLRSLLPRLELGPRGRLGVGVGHVQ